MGKAEQLNTRYRWYMSYLANRKSESGPWDYLGLQAALTNKGLNEAIHREIGADVPVEITPPDVTARSFGDELTHVDTHMTRLIEVE